MAHFIPDKYKRLELREDEKRTQQSTRNQPEPVIVTFTIANPKPQDLIGFYFITPRHPVDYKRFAERLAKLYGVDVKVEYEDFLNWFMVRLEKRVEYGLIEIYTMQALEEELSESV